MTDPRCREAAFNRSSRDLWQPFAPHRAKVSARLAAGGDPGRMRLAVLGAGNANDLDLPALLAAHREVHLVDLDREALALGAARQGVDRHAGLRLHGGVDVTAMLDAVAAWTPLTDPGAADLEALTRWPADRVARALPGPFDVTASTCLLSQLVGSACVALGAAHPKFGAVAQGVRTGHLRLLAALTAPGGSAELITDVVSTDLCPELRSTPESGLPALLPRLAASGRFIHGCHPDGVLAAVKGDPWLRPRVARLEPAAPWTWRLHDRDYLVWALSLRLAAGPR